MSTSFLLFFMIILFLLLVIFTGTPIAVGLGVAAVAELLLQGEVPLMIAAQRIYNGVNSVTLMGIPFFMLVGSIMERSGITQKLIDFANSLVGWLRGGLCYVGVLTGILMGGIIPGIMIGLSFILLCAVICLKRGYDKDHNSHLSLKFIGKAFLHAILPILAPLIIVGGILTGIFTATESAIAAVAYTLFLALVIYRSISLKDLPKMFVDSIINASNVMFIIGTSSLFAWIMQSNKFQEIILNMFGSSVNSRLWVMLIVNIVFFIGGFFLEGTAMQIMFIPVLYPVVQAAGISPIAFGVTVICNIAIGNLTPPVGVCLYVAANSAGAKVNGIIKEIIPFVLVAVLDIVILVVFPQLIDWIPSLMHG